MVDEGLEIVCGVWSGRRFPPGGSTTALLRASSCLRRSNGRGPRFGSEANGRRGSRSAAQVASTEVFVTFTGVADAE